MTTELTAGARVRDGFHAARWLEPIILELSCPGQRGVVPPAAEAELVAADPDPLDSLPSALRREDPPRLPELAQPQVLRHFLRLSQETMGAAVNIDVGLGTCTMKYNPVINDVIASDPTLASLHPRQPVATIQGLLRVLHRLERQLAEIAGMDAFSLQPGAGASAIFANASIIRAFHEANGQGNVRDEMITTVFSHPADAAAPAVAGYRVITLHPGPNGYPELEALEAAISERTAGLMMTNPEDTGLFNPHIRAFTKRIHEAGGLCAIDQANANATLGVVRARDLGFDLCHFNLHKTFATPHGSEGPALGAVGVRADLAMFLPSPVIVERDGRFELDHDRPASIGKIKAFLGNVGVALRAYAWIMAHGSEWLREVAEIAVLNNNYLARRLRDVPGLSVPYDEAARYRLQEIRYSWRQLYEDTGVTTDDIKNRMVDFGVNNYFTSHEPWIIDQPFTPEPAESYSKDDLDQYAQIVRRVAEEAYADPQVVRSGPHRSSIGRMDLDALAAGRDIVTTWRAWQRRKAPS